MSVVKEGREEDVMTYLSTQDWQKNLDRSVVIAIKDKQPRIMKLLVEEGANLDQSVLDDWVHMVPLLFEAFRGAYPDILDTFLTNYKGDIASQFQDTVAQFSCEDLLIIAVETQRFDFVKRAISFIEKNNITLDKSKRVCPLLCYAASVALHNRQNATSNDEDPNKTSSGCAILDYLLEQGFNVNSTKSWVDCDTPLHVATKAGNIEVVKCLIKHGADVMAKDEFANTPLLCAVQMGNKEVVQCLINHGADVMASGFWNDTPLHCAAVNGNKKVVQCLIKNGADVLAVWLEKDSYPWMIACERKDIGLMTALLHGVDLKRKLPDGGSVLHQVCINGWIDGIKYLLENGADVNCTDENNLTPLFAICLNQHLSWISGLGHHFRMNKYAQAMHLMTLLIDAGADVNHHDRKGHTMLMKRKIFEQKDLRQFLIQHGADLNAVGLDGLTVLWAAIEYAHETGFYLINDLLARNIDIGLSHYKHNGMTPLQLAYSKRYYGLCNILLDAGCSLHSMLEFMDVCMAQELAKNKQRVRTRVVKLSSRPYSLQELSRQSVLRGMGSGNLVEKVLRMKEDKILPTPLLNFLLRNLSEDPWFDF